MKQEPPFLIPKLLPTMILDGQLFHRGLNTTELGPVGFGKMNPLLNYQEGLGFKIRLDDQSKLYFQKYGSDQLTTIPLSIEAQDVAITHTYEPNSFFGVHPKINSQFSQSCRIAYPIYDPWMKKTMGVNNDGKLVFEGSEQNLCLIFSGFQKDYGPARSVQVRSFDGDDLNFGYVSSYLEVTFKTYKLRIFPYSDQQIETALP